MDAGGQEIAKAVTVLGDVFVTGFYAWAVWTGRTKPHPFSWLVWGLVLVFGSLGQYAIGAGPAVLFPLTSGALCLFIAGKTFSWYGLEDVFLGDKIILVFALALGLLGALTSEEGLATVLFTSVVFLGYVPSFRKAWLRPQEENLTVFFLYTLLSLLNAYTAVPLTLSSGLYPCTLILANGGLVALLFARRRRLA